jgi:heat shock protein HslJ
MNKFAALLAAGMLLSGCVYNSKVSTGAEQLQHHRFVLTSVNGQALNAADKPLELSFGERWLLRARCMFQAICATASAGRQSLGRRAEG